MHTRNALLPALAALLAGVTTTAPVLAQKSQASRGQATEAAVSKAPLGVPLAFSVEGLNRDNLDKVTKSLTSMTETVYACPACKHVEPKAGNCSSCEVALEAKRKPILAAAVPSVGKESIQLTPFAARTLSYSALVNALAASSVAIDDSKFPLAGEARLVLRGGSSEDLEVIQAALNTSGLFKGAKATWDDVTTEIHVAVNPAATPPTQEKVAAVIEALDTDATLVDVMWGPQRVPVAKS